MSLTSLFTLEDPRPSIGTKTCDATAVSRRRAAAGQFLLRHLTPAKDESGLLFYSRIKGRVLESALVLHILRKNELDHDWQKRLRDFLVKNTPSADPFSAAVAGAVMASSDDNEKWSAPRSFAVKPLLRSVPYAKGRKHALLAAILGEVGALSVEGEAVDPSLFIPEATHLFSRLYMAAAKIIYANGTYSPSDLEDDAGFLVRAQGIGGDWQQQGLITIVALLALGPRHPSFDKGLAFLKTLVREDGGVAFCDNLDLWTTSLAALALMGAEEVPAESFPRVAAYIVSRQRHDDGWAFSDGIDQTDADTTAQCVLMLLLLDPERYAEPIARAHRYYLRVQRNDGGYPTYEGSSDSEVTITANVALVQALSLQRHPKLRGPLAAALAFLEARQRPDGTFERSWSLCETYSVFRVLLALNACRDFENHAASAGVVRRASLRYVLGSQHEADGGWGQTASEPSDALSSSYALLSLVLLRPLVPAGRFDRGLSFLLSQQVEATGEVVSVPDLVGPRPIACDAPLLSTVFAMMALRVVECV